MKSEFGLVEIALLECLVGSEPLCPGLCEPRTADLGVAVCVAICRHRYIVDPQDVAEGAKTLAARADALKCTLQATGLDILLERLVEVRKLLWFDSGRPELPLRTAAALLDVH